MHMVWTCSIIICKSTRFVDGDLNTQSRGGVIFCLRRCSNISGAQCFWTWKPSSIDLENECRNLPWSKMLSELRDPAPGTWRSGSKRHPWPPDFGLFFDWLCLQNNTWSRRTDPALIWVTRNTLNLNVMQSRTCRTTQIRASPRNRPKLDIIPPLDRVLRSPHSYKRWLGLAQ